MANLTQQNYLPNSSTSLFQTTTYFDDVSTTNSFSNVSDVRGSSKLPFVVQWTSLQTFRHSYWSVELAIAALGVVGNVLVLVMMTDRKLRSVSYSMYLNFLAVSDSSLLLARLADETEITFLPGRSTELGFCVASFVAKILAMLLSPWLVVGLTLDRYICVSSPLSREKFCTRKKALAVCSAMLGVSVVSILPFPFSLTLVRGVCTLSEDLKYYFIVIRILLSSTLPCLIILVLNILIIIQIRRSRSFRNMFRRSDADSANRQHDTSTRPLVLISVLAFVTMIPVALASVAFVALGLSSPDSSGRAISSNIFEFLILIYLLNFGQNFYILIASSSNYRQILRKRLTCCVVVKRSQVNEPNEANLTNISGTHGSQNNSTLPPASYVDVEDKESVSGDTCLDVF